MEMIKGPGMTWRESTSSPTDHEDGNRVPRKIRAEG
jgi:hypothetical protein